MFRVAQAHMDNIRSRWLKNTFRCTISARNGTKNVPNLSKNDLVWIIDHREERVFYRLGRVKKCHFGSDGNIRFCDMLTHSGSCFSTPRSSCPLVLDDIGVCFLPKKNTGPAMKRPEKQLRKKTSICVILKSHNFGPNKRINPKLAVNLVLWPKLPD